ncbi:MAG: tetratricopeptide repeat protein [Spirochaetales bacterium]|nr:tetratricopeptide repeat protein [Spirochaetales bacterium]MCF7939378.1 tetratricopeptide repeat protein [Spirochaetales bacterium]
MLEGKKQRLLGFGLIVLIIASLVLFYLVDRQRSSWINLFLERTDLHLRQGSYDQARRYLLAAEKYSRFSGEYLRLARRAYEYGQETGNFNILANLETGIGSSSQTLSAAIAYGKTRTSQFSAEIVSDFSPFIHKLVPPERYLTLYQETDNEVMRFLLGLQLLREGSYEKAYQHLSASVSYSGLDQSTQEELLFRTAFDGRNYLEAQKRLSALVSLNPDEPRYRFFIADVLMLQGEYQKAEERLRRLIDSYPDCCSQPYRSLAWLLMRNDKPEEAVQVLKRGISVFPENARLAASFVYLQDNDSRETRSLFRSFEDQENPEFELAEMLIFEDRFRSERFQVLLQQLHQQGHELAGPMLAWFEFGTGDVAELNRITKHSENSPEGWKWFYRGSYHAVRGNTLQAIEEYKAVTSGRYHPWSVYNEAVLHLHRGNTRLAEGSLQDLVFQNPPETIRLASYRRLAEIAERKQEEKRAADYYRRILEMKPGDPDAKLRLKQLE